MLSELSNMSSVVNGPILYITAVSLVLLIGITAAMVYFSFRYSRRRNPKSEDIHGNMVLEIVWTIVPTILAFTMFWYGWIGYKYMRSPPDDAMRVKVTGQMWSWSHEYENGVVTSELNVPVGKAVRLDLHAVDVIHSYFIPAFKVKQDLVPGRDDLFLWFEAREVGEYNVFCAEYCGLQHSAMLTMCNVMTVEDFDAWLAAEGEKVAELETTIAKSGDNARSTLHLIGKRLATSNGCVACHSSDGSRLVGPSFKSLYGKVETVITAGETREITADDDYLRNSIINPMDDIVDGYQPLMPPQGDLLSDDDIAAIIEYIKSLE